MKRPSPAAETADSTEFPPPAPPNHRKKKTRVLPNLSDCNCCNRRINNTNPKNRLQILASKWRIVLLCKSCYNLVESSQCCSYCLTRVSSSSMESLYECKRCRRRIHKECSSTFSFGGSGNCSSSSSNSSCRSRCDDYFVCFDCWIPKLLENEYNARVLLSRTKKKGVKFGGDTTNSLGSSVVCDSQDKGKALEDVVNDAHFVAQKKIKVAVEAKEKAIEQASVAKRAVELAKSAVGTVSIDKGGDQGGSVVDDDAQLAFRLHRAMNSSPRISRNLCLLSTHSVEVPEVNGTLDGVEASYSSKPPINIGGDEQNGLAESRGKCDQKCPKTHDEKHNGDVGCSLIMYIRKGRASLGVKCKEEPNSRTCTGGWSSGDVITKEEPNCLMQTYSRRQSKVNRCKVELGNCSKTYSRRHPASPHCKSKMMYGSCNLNNGTIAPAIASRFCEESRGFTTTT